MELSAWLPVGSVGALIVLIIGLNQVMLHRMETRLTKQIEDVRSLMAGHTHPPSEEGARFRMP